MQQPMAGLQHYIRDYHVKAGRIDVPNFFSKDDQRFVLLRSALDARMKELTASNVGIHKKQAAPISRETENTFCKGVFGNNLSQALLDTLFFYSCTFLDFGPETNTGL